jgi:hypothetical protein
LESLVIAEKVVKMVTKAYSPWGRAKGERREMKPTDDNYTNFPHQRLLIEGKLYLYYTL